MNGRILTILTGGTICSSVNADGKRYSDARNVRIIEAFERSGSPYAGSVSFETVYASDILSENMTTTVWNHLLRCFADVHWADVDGVIVLHGTDTLAYTSAMLAVALRGLPHPVVMVSAQLPLSEPESNGHANFRAAVALIESDVKPNVYAVYRNADGNMYVHTGAALRQCQPYSNDFHSDGETVIEDIDRVSYKGVRTPADKMILRAMRPLRSDVMLLEPYVGMDYGRIRIEGLRAVVHTAYHSGTLCVSEKAGSASVITLLERCRKYGVSVFVTPVSGEDYGYVTTGELLAHGAVPLTGMTAETVYAKALVGSALGYWGAELESFVRDGSSM